MHITIVYVTLLHRDSSTAADTLTALVNQQSELVGDYFDLYYTHHQTDKCTHSCTQKESTNMQMIQVSGSATHDVM